MTTASATEEVAWSNPSLEKHRLLSRFAQGASWQSVSQEIAKIVPPTPKLSWGRWCIGLVTAVVLGMLIPPWARRDDT